MADSSFNRLRNRLHARLDDISVWKKGIAVVSIPLLVLFITLIVMAWHERVSRLAQDRIRHSLEVKAAIYRVQAALTDSETGMRGYLIWRDPIYLKPYDEARSRLPETLSNLKKLVQNNADMTSAAATVERDAQQKMQAMARMLADPVAARRFANPWTRQSYETMEKLRHTLREMEISETTYLYNRTVQYDNTLARLNVLLMTLFILAILCGISASYIVSTGILDRVHRLELYARRVSRGQEGELTDSGQDELGMLGRSIQVMTNNLLAREDALQQTRQQLQKANQRLKVQLRETQAANEELETFSYSVSHDLRAPLRHVTGFAELLQKSGDELSPKSQRYLNIILSSVNQMGVLIDELLAFSRMGRTDLAKEPVDLNQLIGEVLTNLSGVIQEREIQWKVDELPAVLGDKVMLRLVFQNVIDNAIKYTRGHDTAIIEIFPEEAPDPERTIIAIRDNGVGFNEKYAEKLFAVFQRLHTHEEYEGSGVGLATVRRIVNRHGGQVWAESEVGKGATFRIELPLSPSPDRTKDHE